MGHEKDSSDSDFGCFSRGSRVGRAGGSGGAGGRIQAHARGNQRLWTGLGRDAPGSAACSDPSFLCGPGGKRQPGGGVPAGVPGPRRGGTDGKSCGCGGGQRFASEQYGSYDPLGGADGDGHQRIPEAAAPRYDRRPGRPGGHHGGSGTICRVRRLQYPAESVDGEASDPGAVSVFGGVYGGKRAGQRLSQKSEGYDEGDAPVVPENRAFSVYGLFGYYRRGDRKRRCSRRKGCQGCFRDIGAGGGQRPGRGL